MTQKQGLFSRLTKSRQALGEGLKSIFSSSREISDDMYYDLEDQLLIADLGVDTCNTVIESLKQKDRKNRYRTSDDLLEGLRVISGLIYPVMPDTSARMQKHLGQDITAPFYLLDRIRNWKSIEPGTRLPKSVNLFPRVDPADNKSAPAHKPAETTGGPAIKEEITLEEFGKIDLRAATVLKAEKIPRAKKLLRLEVDLGHTTTIVAGIAEKYTPEELVGKQIIIVANLKPAKLMGIISNGMLLAAVDDQGPTVATLDKPVDSGTPLK